MGRRKIEIKAIKDDRNRSVTFLKRKGGLFKKAHELSVLCSVDVAVIIFGSNKKLYEYSSNDMRDLIGRYTYHGGPNEHKGPNDFNGGGDDGSDDEVDGTPPPGMQNEAVESHMMPPHYPGQAPPQFAQFRHGTPSASPPIPNGVGFAQHAAATQAIQRGHTPQPPQNGSRPTSRNDMRRMPPNVPQPGPPQGPHQPNGYAFMPHPAIYNPQAQQNMAPNMNQPGPQYPPYAPPATTHAPPPHMQQYVDERPASMPPNFPPQVPQGPQGNSLPPPPQVQQRHSVSPPQAHAQHPQTGPRTSPPNAPSLPPPPQHNPHPNQQQPQVKHEDANAPHPPQIQEPQPPTPVEPKPDPEWHEVKKLPQRKQYSIFTPIDESRSILSQHLAAFRGESVKAEPSTSGAASTKNIDVNSSNRSQSVDSGNMASRSSATSSPPSNKAADSAAAQMPQPKSRVSISSIPETMFTPPSRQSSLRPGGPLRPRLRVEIPPDGSEDNSAATGTGGSASSPRNPSDAGPLGARRNGDTHTGMVLPPPSPSASAILSAGASGPPNPFARPIPHQSSNTNNNSSSNNMHIDTPGSALPSRFLNNELLPSPSSFYPEWGFGRGNDSATLPSPLNFATPIVGTGPSFLRDDHASSNNKRKSPEASAGASSSDPIDHSNEPKRVKVDS
ncbi:srf-type transcription factor [Sporothrix brasiliensis 5110]|uniref:MADS-box MEF2 type transcription factor MIG1 n=1 Tax=Sporothrix brasiliensis 5110 TaxID=1398154 RepID=A0A0C2FLB3_9PEZI|nr:srf-type transcription factor [Sporothrix brasiliensis 5110]KIH91873.1 srf-type transcription factor [Sporothrix brasiliensis 5110]